MRIALATDWFAPRRGGIESQLLQLADGLGSRGHQVDVLTSTPGAVDGRGFRARPLDVAILPRLQLAVSPSLLSALRRELARGYDVLHAHVSVISPVGYAAAAVARAMGMPTVVTFHSVLRHKRYLLRFVNSVAGLGESAVVWSAVSTLVAAQVRAAVGARDAAVLANGIDLAFWRDAPGTARPPDATITLVATARLHSKKRPRALVRAFAQALSRTAVRARLLVVGDGPERPAIERDVRELGIEGAVQLLGWLEPHDLRSLYAESDCFVMASTRESFGIAALEARAAGLPVIAMSASGSGDFLTHGHNALLCGDDIELAQSLSRFLSDPSLRPRLAMNAGALDRYDWSVVLGEHEAAYRRAMTRAATGAVATSV